MNRFFFALATAMIFGQALAQPSPSEIKAFDISKAKELVSDELSDPESAKFRRMFLSNTVNAKGENRVHLCGEVNAKNKMGGYSGYRKFFADANSAIINPNAEDEESVNGVRQQLFDLVYPRACTNKIKEIK